MRYSFNLENIFFRYTIGIGVFVLLLAAGAYAYLGTFSRYGGDDYCEAARIYVASSPIAAVFQRYFAEDWPRATMRYSNLLFVGFSESLGSYKMQITMASMVVLWFAGCVWLAHEIRKLLKIEWPFLLDLFLGLTFGFFSLKQAPNLFETVYWRSAMMTHFAPLVFGLFLFAFVIRQVHAVEEKPSSPLMYIFIIAVTFIIAGFSEPPTTTLLTAIPLLMLAVWLWGSAPVKGRILALLASVFIGALLGLLAMLLSPATSDSTQEKSISLIQILWNSFKFSYEFIIDSLKTQPLPLLLVGLIPLLFMWLRGQIKPSALSSAQRRNIFLIMIATPILAWLLIAAGFSPSVYGQSYPVERMRFLARALLIASFMLEGALLGLLLAQYTFRPNPGLAQAAAAVLFAVIAIGYPLRTAAGMIRTDIPEYRARAEKWDAREAYIREMKNEGVPDLTVPFLSGEVIQDLGDRRDYRLNRCASIIYGVNSILAVPMDGE